MDKKILNEVNRNREIMGLDRLLVEANNEYKYLVKDAKEIKDMFEKLEKKVKKSYPNGISSIPGYDDLITKFGQTRIPARGLKGNKLHPHTIVVAIAMNMGWKKFVKAVENDYTFKVEETAQTVQVQGDDILTRGKVWAHKVNVVGRYKNGSSATPSVIAYTNGYNLRHFAAGGDKGWDTKEMMDDGYLDYTTGPSSVGPYLYLYAATFGGKQTAADGEDITDTQKGYKATGKYPTTYSSGDSTPDEKLVAKAVKEILVMFPADVKLDLFTLKAGASANWGSEETLPNSEGRGDTGYAEGNEGKNQKLAFDRGNNFMMAVNKGLKSQNHPGFDNYEVQWVVEGQDESSQFIDLMLSVDKEDKIVTRNIGTVISGKKTIKTGKNTIARFEVVFTDGSF
jgi:hypothetical protein